jgi:DNA-binding NtrC family response regulator
MKPASGNIAPTSSTNAARAPAAAPRPATILVVDDEPEIRRLLAEILEDEHYTVLTAENAQAARELYRRERPDLVLLDIWMPDTDGISLLKEWAGGGLEAPVIMISGHGTVETAIEATRLGAHDFIEKPLSTGKLLVTVQRALESSRLARENRALRRAVAPESLLTGRSRAIRELRETLERIATADAWVLVSGEPGSGKGQAARFLHAHSRRSRGPFVEIGLSALSAAEAAVRLYGEEREGRATPGALEQAGGGTLVLNEIGDLDPAAQAALATVLAERRFRRVGGREWLTLDARLVTLSPDDPAAAVAAGRLREDLYYRLNVVPVAIPPLRDHREDVPELVGFYVNWLVDHEGLPYRRFTTGALNALRNHAWPGNLRELRNVVQRLLILNAAPEVSEAEVTAALAEAAEPAAAARTLFELPLKRAREEFERAYLEHHLGRTGGSVAELARLTGMERTHLYRKLKQLGLHPRDLKE